MNPRIVILSLLMLTAFCSLNAQSEVPRDSILKDAEWRTEYDAYTPDPAVMAALGQKALEGLRIDVYLAFWCGDSRNNVPRFLKIIDQFGKCGLEVHFYEVARKSGPEQKYYVESLQVERVPTFIFLRGGKEIGRIVENPQTDMAEDMLLKL